MVPMELRRSRMESVDVGLSSLLSCYLLSDPPSPPSALPTILRFIQNRKPLSNSQASHKWITRISSLIQSKSAESRFWGVCLAKAAINSGGEGTVHAVTWAKLLSAILNVPVPEEVTNTSDLRELCFWNEPLQPSQIYSN